MTDCGHLRAEMQRNVFSNVLERLQKDYVGTESAKNQ